MTTPRRALLVDYGGVLTGSLGNVFRQAEQRASIPEGTLVQVLLDAYADRAGDGFVHRFERGEIDTPAFEAEMRAALETRGHLLDDTPLMGHVFAGLGPDLDNGMWALVRTARASSILTGLLSNSWGVNGYPMARLNECFDDLVISGEVGLRKPDPAIYQLAAERLEVDPGQCAFVDDFPGNVEAARELGMFGVLHRGDTEATAVALEGYFGCSLR